MKVAKRGITMDDVLAVIAERERRGLDTTVRMLAECMDCSQSLVRERLELAELEHRVAVVCLPGANNRVAKQYRVRSEEERNGIQVLQWWLSLEGLSEYHVRLLLERLWELRARHLRDNAGLLMRKEADAAGGTYKLAMQLHRKQEGRK